MEQLSMRGFDKELVRRLRKVARERELSLNRAALLLMRRGAGIAEEKSQSKSVGASLDRFIGSWSAADEKRVLKAIEPLGVVDVELWK
ncbi:MAG: hypothetical protein ABIR28_09700 [Vicinamibacteria bacterium]